MSVANKFSYSAVRNRHSIKELVAGKSIFDPAALNIKRAIRLYGPRPGSRMAVAPPLHVDGAADALGIEQSHERESLAPLLP